MCRRDLVAAANWSLKARSNAKRAATWLPFFNTGAGEESRTLDLNLGKVALYQLSYSRIGVQHHSSKLLLIPVLLFSTT